VCSGRAREEEELMGRDGDKDGLQNAGSVLWVVGGCVVEELEEY